MKKIILTTSLLIAMTLPAYAVEEHHPAQDAAPAAKSMAAKKDSISQVDMKKMDATMMDMQQTCKKMLEATNPTERETLMQQHMQQMKEGMMMMDKMMGQDKMMDKKMQMMMKMMMQMMSQQEMMMKK